MPPLYEYECFAGVKSHRFEVLQPMSEKGRAICPEHHVVSETTCISQIAPVGENPSETSGIINVAEYDAKVRQLKSDAIEKIVQAKAEVKVIRRFLEGLK